MWFDTGNSVPPSRLPDLVYATKEDLTKHGIVNTIIGHVGDGMFLRTLAKGGLLTHELDHAGNFHSLLLFQNEEELVKARAAVKRMVKRALELEGTCTGENGVGLGKREFLVEELGEGTVELMKTVKKAIDPHNLFNPGKAGANLSRPICALRSSLTVSSCTPTSPRLRRTRCLSENLWYQWRRCVLVYRYPCALSV